MTVEEALRVIAGSWGDGWVLQPPVAAHIPRRESLGGPVPTRRFYAAHEVLGDVLVAQLPAAQPGPAVVRVSGLAADRWTEDDT